MAAAAALAKRILLGIRAPNASFLRQEDGTAVPTRDWRKVRCSRLLLFEERGILPAQVLRPSLRAQVENYHPSSGVRLSKPLETPGTDPWRDPAWRRGPDPLCSFLLSRVPCNSLKTFVTTRPPRAVLTLCRASSMFSSRVRPSPSSLASYLCPFLPVRSRQWTFRSLWLPPHRRGFGTSSAQVACRSWVKAGKVTAEVGREAKPRPSRSSVHSAGGQATLPQAEPKSVMRPSERLSLVHLRTARADLGG